jgi:hypothetical protein
MTALTIGRTTDTSLRRPAWCWPDACTADPKPGAEVDGRYHRSRPLIIETDDPFVVLCVHLLVAVPGSEVEVEISELERPFTQPWFDTEPARGRQLAMSLDRADTLRHVLASLVRAAPE